MIRTPRLLLRRATMDDLAAMHCVLSDPRATLYWSTPPHETVEVTAAWMESMISSTPEQSEDFIIERDGAVIGKIGAWRLPELGYIIHPDHWGQGLTTEALAAFLDHVARRPDVTHLTADVDPRNAPSIRLLEKYGFYETGRTERTAFTQIGWCDSVYFRKDF
ncbi:GNAT family N-acetyltransferase [Allosphingosinicella vermicomposti]|uniref:GNAT family N-acetyltransferase n=1 Tax=Allosphingosinicella vermicomposti TaxID=614671 RepID=UPI000D0F8F35|nr:GNAT family N-acetyltransferase [Allosphingosinicella vermicomposti]